MSGIETIAAIATAPGAGGVGIVRVSGPRTRAIARAVCGRLPRARRVVHACFRDAGGEAIDDGIALFFAAPASYTGEDVLELQAHGSRVVLEQLLERVQALGARPARPGEFSERAFLNGKLDLAQAEAIADLIAAGDRRAARAARRSLDGEFSARVAALAEGLLAARVQVEALIDFADEAIEPRDTAALAADLASLAGALDDLRAAADRGRRLRDGLHAVLVGPPNAGKSSLLNALAGAERAIVTEIPGTTRDLLQETLRVDGVELTLVDTAGLRAGGDAIEREGMRRARAELDRADLALVVLDARAPEDGRAEVAEAIAGVPQVLWLFNKIDLAGPSTIAATPSGGLAVSALTGEGLATLHARLADLAGAGADGAEGGFSARTRHVDALARAAAELGQGRGALASGALDLAAEALRCSHDALGEITGRVLPDALLGHIFATFCIGK